MHLRAGAVVLSLLLLSLACPADVGAAGYVAPKRTVGQVAHAIGVSNPGVTKADRRRLAEFLVGIAREHNFDPLSGWAIIDHESDWRADAVSADGHDIGLAQIRYTVSSACREDRESEACQARREELLDPAANIRAMAGAISAWRKLCEKKTGRPANMQNWLAGYGGYSKPKRNIFCGRQRVRTKKGYRWKELPVPEPVADIVAARKAMLRRLKKDGVK